MMLGMEQSDSASLALDKAQKQKFLIDTIDRYGPSDIIDITALRRLINEIDDINYYHLDLEYYAPVTPLIRAIFKGNLSVIREILATPGLDIGQNYERAMRRYILPYPIQPYCAF